jgi:hypothetical protein
MDMACKHPGICSNGPYSVAGGSSPHANSTSQTKANKTG